jgi:hypothetical protein
MLNVYTHGSSSVLGIPLMGTLNMLKNLIIAWHPRNTVFLGPKCGGNGSRAKNNYVPPPQNHSANLIGPSLSPPPPPKVKLYETILSRELTK